MSGRKVEGIEPRGRARMDRPGERQAPRRRRNARERLQQILAELNLQELEPRFLEPTPA